MWIQKDGEKKWTETERIRSHARLSVGDTVSTLDSDNPEDIVASNLVRVIEYHGRSYNEIKRGQVIALAPKGLWGSSAYWVISIDGSQKFTRVAKIRGEFYERTS
jgi:hypothetical protein